MIRFKKILAASIAALLVLQCFPATAFAAASNDNRGALSTPAAGSTNAYTVNLSTSWASAYFSFTPSYTGWYSFYSVKSSGDPYFYLLTGSTYLSTVLSSVGSAGCKNTSINSYVTTYNDDANGNYDFLVSNQYLTAGTTYYAVCTKYSATATNYTFYVSRLNSYYNVSYNANGGTGSMSSQTMYHNSTYSLRSNTFTMDEYTFAGWNTNASGTGTNYSNGQSVSNLLWSNGGTFPLYAKWTRNTHSVTLNRGSGSGGSASVSSYYGATAMPSITKPTAPTGYNFQGYYTGTNGTGTKYYNADGTSAHTFDFTNSTATKTKNTTLTLYAYYAPQQYTLILNNQGGTGGNSAPLVYNQPYPTSVTVPTRTGYVFDGYYGIDNANVINLSDKYYDGTGAQIKAGNFTGSANVTVYAKWYNANVTLTVDLDGGTWTDWDGNLQSGEKAYTLLGNVQKAITNAPVRSGYIFAGWTMEGNARLNDATKILTMDSTMSTTQTARLTALWNAPENLVTVVADENASANQNALTEMYNNDNLVTDPEFGITAEELANSPTLTLNVNPITVQAGEGEYGSRYIFESEEGNHNYAVQSLINSTSGTVPDTGAIFDVYVEKAVGGETTRLKQIPSPIGVDIPLTGELAGRTSYQVWHFHENQVELLTEATEADGLSQWFEYDNPGTPTKITVYLSRFSEIVVAYGQVQTTGQGLASEIIWDNSNNTDFDVQGKVLESDSMIYKVDITWGAMAFEYSKGALWDPVNHEYTSAAINDWLPEGFIDGNNEITVHNHSNGGLFASFNIQPRTGTIAKSESNTINLDDALAGVDMKVRVDNSDYSDEALNMSLPKVAYSGDLTAPSIQVFVRLMGTPADVAGLDTANKYQEGLGAGYYLRLAKVTVTLTPNAADGRTPLYVPRIP